MGTSSTNTVIVIIVIIIIVISVVAVVVVVITIVTSLFTTEYESYLIKTTVNSEKFYALNAPSFWVIT